MAFVDELSVNARAGRGGDGVVRWLHLKGKEYSGPAGGNGGDGGSVYMRAVRDIALLARYRGSKEFIARDGEPGGNQNKQGSHGADLTIDVPMGSVVRNSETGEVHELLEEGERKLVLKGGRGGAGNAVFKSSVNRTPKEATPGGRGEEALLYIELRLIADAGLVGLPNAGKSSLLNALTGASAKIGAYPFTTLEPNLGVLYGYVLADIPGLLEQASRGRGLGFKFLRHIARTRLLVHCVSLDGDDPLRDYQTVHTELQKFEDGALAKKPELVVLTKSDTKDTGYIAKVQERFAKEGIQTTTVSILDDAEVQKLQTTLLPLLR